MGQIVAHNREKVNLRQISRKDKAWDLHKAKADIVASLYENHADGSKSYLKRAERMRHCAGFLRFGKEVDSMGRTKLHLIEARFCHQKSCVVCQWRRSLMLKAKFYNNLPSVLENNPDVTFIFLTLTVRNCDLKDLRTTIQKVHRAFNNMTKREFFIAHVAGYVRALEVTKNDDTQQAHPHLHILLAMKKSYFQSSNYMTKAKWTMLWQVLLGVDYIPQVHVETVYKKDKFHDHVQELLKYPVKESDIDINSTWFLEYCRQVHHLRFIGTGGILKDIVKDVKTKDDSELIKINDTNEHKQVTDILDFSWNRTEKRYKRV